ncbi:hypothetical protein LPTSP4_30640 [Leptospira ryugenii]|uniref:Uncharacterized protein n=1 Tax=Leptospira ryugenii TaxID=1917863 RepID=A0A2P2E3V9_9LEPT|nr:hypothetical protein [Leptospira ryugenii]GBF51526.1 hypothetical protein LPTSP4_30640 [Leptospira ryugenii]
MNCLAKEKLFLFLQEKVTFRVGISAFHQAHPTLLEEFLVESKENRELITYFLYINEPPIVKDAIENFSAKTLANLFRADFESFDALPIKDRRKRNIFEVRSYRYWKYINFQKICDTIVYFLREENSAYLASQFLVVLPSTIVSNLRDYTGLLPEEEKTLYLALGDAIYELPIQSPKIYDHMLSLFSEDMEIFMILSTMEELIKRHQRILDLTEKLLHYSEKNRLELNIQFIFSELNGLDIETSSEILNQLLDKKVISQSQKNLVLEFLINGNLDILKPLKIDLLR